MLYKLGVLAYQSTCARKKFEKVSWQIMPEMELSAREVQTASLRLWSAKHQVGAGLCWSSEAEGAWVLQGRKKKTHCQVKRTLSILTLLYQFISSVFRLSHSWCIGMICKWSCLMQ